MSDPSGIGRRPLLAAIAGLFGVAAVATGGFEAFRYFGGARRHSGLLALVADSTDAARFGQAVLSERGRISAGWLIPNLKARIGKSDLPAVLGAEIAKGRVVEVDGWVVPETLSLLCALAAMDR